MCQARRPPQTVDKQAEAQRDVARIGYELQDALDKQGIELTLASCERAVTELLHRGTVKVGRRPPEVEAPIPGQVTIDDA